MRTKTSLAVVAALLIVSAQLAFVQTALAADKAQSKNLKIELDPAQTEIHWKLGGLHTTHGTFKLKSGQLFFNPVTGVAEGEILVDATTGESGNADRDKHMQQDVLESNRYPAIFFHPSHVKGEFKAGEGTQQLVGQGTFNIHGADHPLEMPLTVQVTGNTVKATSTFTVPYVAWGMKDPSKLFLRVSKQVEIEITTTGTVKHED